jgi:exodeoxyribonuclease V gamma subunit
MPELRLKIINSNDISVLASACATIMRASPLSSPLGREKILILNSGMKNYLSEYIADANGISAGVDYMQLWEFVWQAYKQVCGDQGRDNFFARDAVAWSLMSMKDEWGRGPFREITRPLSRYVQVGDSDEPDVRLYELCSKIADTFDQYQMYRPEWIMEWDDLTDADFEQWEAFKESKDPAPSMRPGRVRDALWRMTPRRLRGQDGRIPPQVLANDWQPYLWSRLRPNMRGWAGTAENRSELRFLDRPQLIRAFIAKLRTGGGEVDQALPARIFVAGVSSLPGQVIDLLCELGRRTEVYMLFLNPCHEYWGDLRCGRSPRLSGSGALRGRILDSSPALRSRGLADASHDDPANPGPAPESDAGDELTDGFSPLLSASGREARDMLSALCSQPEDRLPEICNFFAEPGKDDALSLVKGGMYSLEASRRPGVESAPRDEIRKGDDSLVFVSCHTRRREVEELRDMLLEKFKRASVEGRKLSPGEVLVMTPAIEQYAPDIEAVFGSMDESSPGFIPYAISDRSVTRQDPAADAILRIMGVGEEPVTVGFVLGLLAVPEIARSFGFSDEDADMISKWCIGAGIHWGLDDAEVKSDMDGADVPPLPWTFESGISRILEGFMKGRGARGGSYAEVEGSDAEAAGRFWHFVRSLEEVRGAFEELGSEDGGMFDEDEEDGSQMRFTRLIPLLLDRFLDKNSEEGAKFKDVLWGLSKIPGMLRNAPKVSLRVLRLMLSDALEHKVDEGRFCAGAVNFCSMLPMRAVPFRHIFILGLNDGEFPRGERAPGFNLLSSPQFFRRGDRSRPADDRYLFLEAILSARDSLTLSYTGQNPSDGSPMEPSPVVSELREWLDDNLECEGGKPSEMLTVKSRLNAYDPENYDRKARAAMSVPRLPSFDFRSYVGSKSAGAPDGTPIGLAESFGQTLPASSSVTPDGLAGFLKHPCRDFLKRVGVALQRDEEEPEDVEPFELDFLQRGSFKNWMIGLGDGELEEELADREQSGLLPAGVFWQRQKKSFVDFRSSLRKALEQKAGMTMEELAGSEMRMFDSASEEIISFSAQELGLEGKDAGGIASSAAASLAGSARRHEAVVQTYSHELPLLPAMCHAVAQALAFEDGEHELWLCGSDMKVIRFKPFTRQEALEALRVLLKYWLLGQMRPLPLWNELFKEKGRKTLGEYLGLKQPARNASSKDAFHAPGFGHDDDAKYLFGDSSVCNDRKNGEHGPCFELMSSFYKDVVFGLAETHLEDK